MSEVETAAHLKRPSAVVNAAARAVVAVRADDDMLELIKAYESLDPKAIEKLTPAEARANPTVADAVQSLLARQGRSSNPADLVPGVTSEDRTIPGSATPLAVRIYLPTGAGPLPAILYFHGGGWVLADKDVYDAGARALAKQARAIVISVDYRLAPEHKFPAGWDDAFAAYRWLLGNAESLGADPARLALAGESAGGGLAVATAIAVRDARLPLPRHILAVYPVAQSSTATESYLENAIAKPLNRAMMVWFFAHVAQTEDELDDPRIDLVNADLRGLPRVTIITAGIDPLRSDGALLADALRAAGVDVEHRDYDGVTHEFFGCAAVLAKARAAQVYAAERLRESFR